MHVSVVPVKDFAHVPVYVQKLLVYQLEKETSSTACAVKTRDTAVVSKWLSVRPTVR